MKLHSLMHVPFENAANIETWALERGHHVSHTCLYNGETPPDPQDVDWLAIMGGPMNVYEHGAHPWLVAEKAYLREIIDRGKVVLGICLGAQLLCEVLGGEVTRNPEVEIGWFPAELTPEARASALFETWPSSFTAFHWHGDTFSIPPGAVHVAKSAACANQAFAYEDRVAGLQFHLEYAPQSIEAMLRHCREELVPGAYIQDEAAILEGHGHVRETWSLLERLLDSLARINNC